MIDREKAVSTATIHDEILKAAATITTSTRVRFFQTYSVSPNNRCFKMPCESDTYTNIVAYTEWRISGKRISALVQEAEQGRNSRNSCRPEILISSRAILLGSCIIRIEITSISFNSIYYKRKCYY